LVFSGTHSSRAFSRLLNPPASSRWCFSSPRRLGNLHKLLLAGYTEDRGTGRNRPRVRWSSRSRILARRARSARSPGPHPGGPASLRGRARCNVGRVGRATMTRRSPPRAADGGWPPGRGGSPSGREGRLTPSSGETVQVG